MARVTVLAESVRSRARRSAFFALAVALLQLTACSSSGDDDDEATGGKGTSGGNSGVGSGSGGFSVTPTGGAFTTGGKLGTGGARLGTGGVNSTGDGGVAQGGQVASGGNLAQAGIGGIPGAGPDGNSPYQRECHGETAMCVDVASLRCLGIRDGTSVAGYSCSNPCQSEADCSKVASSADAAPACVDFVTQKHCLLVCQQQGKTFSCPTGMDCYVYPGSPTGYCLWQ